MHVVRYKQVEKVASLHKAHKRHLEKCIGIEPNENLCYKCKGAILLWLSEHLLFCALVSVEYTLYDALCRYLLR